MSYRQEKGQVILTMSQEDYEKLLMMLAVATGSFLARRGELGEILAFVNRLNSGNPNYTPYQVEAKKL